MWWRLCHWTRLSGISLHCLEKADCSVIWKHWEFCDWSCGLWNWPVRGPVIFAGYRTRTVAVCTTNLTSVWRGVGQVIHDMYWPHVIIASDFDWNETVGKLRPNQLMSVVSSRVFCETTLYEQFNLPG
jgi:hypothetical protein